MGVVSTSRDAAAAAFARLIARGDTTGGTVVQPRMMYADKVAIFPAMSCYTKVAPALYGDGVIRPR
jgi:hypothetical protein